MFNENEDFFKNYRGRYSQYWIERFGLIPELPTSFDNANSIYELIAWLQRAFKQLLDDFTALENEFEDFKNALIDLLEYLIPELIRRFAHSTEFRKIFSDLLKDVLNSDLKQWFKNYLKDILRDPDMREFFKEYLKDIMHDPEMQKWFKDYLKELLNDPAFLKDLKDKLGITEIENNLNKIIDNLKRSGAWKTVILNQTAISQQVILTYLVERLMADTLFAQIMEQQRTTWREVFSLWHNLKTADA